MKKNGKHGFFQSLNLIIINFSWILKMLSREEFLRDDWTRNIVFCHRPSKHVRFHTETEQNPVGLLGHRSLSVSPISCCREQTLASLPSMNSKGQIQRAANRAREWMQRQGRSRCKETTVQPLGQGPGSASRKTRNNIFWALYRTKCMPAQSCSTLCSPRACQAPLSKEFPRKEYWSRLPFPPPGNLPNPGIKAESLVSPALAGKFLSLCHLWSPVELNSLKWKMSAFFILEKTTWGQVKRN